VNYQSILAKQKKKFPPKFDKILGCYRLPPLKEISSPRFGEVRKKDGFGILGGLPPLKETFVDILGFGVQTGHTLVLTWHRSSSIASHLPR
jgi:hypothetical protein